MVDVLTPAQRKLNMSRIRGKGSKPEMMVRRLLHALGYRFRLHRRDLPGTPDIVLPSRMKVVEVRGCYWHMHTCRFGRVVPATNSAFWQEKRLSTVARDKKNLRALQRLGWRTLIIWECEVRDASRIARRLEEFLS
jgi:DNA mismatch endonuclease, patch repair protein